MKNMFKLPVLVIGFLFLIIGTAQKAAAQEEDVSLQTFYDELSPYGTWIQDPQYGYVWRPDVEDQGDFRPYYTNGRWVMTEYGNTWVSNYNWGWAPFHYGRWIYNNYNDWVWIPDTTWGPAWVSWRSGGGYYGWAPLSPGINININFGGGYHIPNSWWCFVPQNNIYYDRYPRYGGYNNVTIIKNTTIINNVYRGGRNVYYTGPGRDDVRRATGRDVRIYNVSRTSSRPDRGNIINNTVNIYSPRPSRGNEGRPAAPRNATTENAYITNRGDRSNRGGVTNTRPVTDRSVNIDRNNNTGNIQGARPSRGGDVNPARTAPVTGVTPSNPNPARPERGQAQPGQKDGSSGHFQPQRWQTRPAQQTQSQPQVQPSRPAAPQPQTQPQRQPNPQPQQQPQRPAPQPQAQQQRQPQQPQQQQQAPPPRENRGGNGGGDARPERGGRN